MTKRKLQSTGGSSLTLTLPKTWTTDLDLRSKDEVEVGQLGSSLIIQPADIRKQEMTVKITIDDLPNKWLLREMIGAYIAGADQIVLLSQRISPQQNQTIRQSVQLLFGFEIIEETSQKVVAHSVLDDARFPVSECTMRIFMITRSMFEDSLKAAQTGDRDLALDLKLRDNEVNKLSHVIQRQFQEILNGKANDDLRSVNFYRAVAIQLERVGDHAVKIAGLASADRTDPVKISGTFPHIQERIHRLLKDSSLMVEKLDRQKAHQILDSDADLERLIYSSKRMKQSYEGALIEDSLDRLRGYIMNIAELTIDYTISTI